MKNNKIVIKLDLVNQGRRESREIFKGMKTEKVFKTKKVYSRKNQKR